MQKSCYFLMLGQKKSSKKLPRKKISNKMLRKRIRDIINIDSQDETKNTLINEVKSKIIQNIRSWRGKKKEICENNCIHLIKHYMSCVVLFF